MIYSLHKMKSEMYLGMLNANRKSKQFSSLARRGNCHAWLVHRHVYYIQFIIKKVILVFGISPKTVGWRSSTPVCLPFQFLAYFVSC